MFRPMRRFKQQVSEQECIRVLREEKRGVLAMLGEDGYPYAIPVNFVYDEPERAVYIHCAKVGYKIDALRACDKVCFTVYDQGFVRPGEWAYNPTSVVIFGRAELVTDEARTVEKARTLGAKYFPTEEELEEELRHAADRVQMVAIHIDHMTGKLVHEQ